ncbi:hypothetical protein [Marinobacterium aestuariivivens]|uniref:Uncharacterized protein n=1 Tax=Marinobacterium aestuariivivens TaxID=1698799 RepID=A0ABW1ZWW6_9GAMM
MMISRGGRKWKVDVWPKGHVGKRVIRRLSQLIEIGEQEHSSTISNGWKYARILKSICDDLNESGRLPADAGGD